MRLLFVSGNRSLQALLREVFSQHGLSAETVTLRTVLATTEQPVVLLHAELWGTEAEAQVQQLRLVTPYVYLICADAGNPRTYVAVLTSGVRDAASDAPLALHALALKLQWVFRAPEPGRWQVGRRVFVPADGCLYEGDRRWPLAPTEVRLLRRLCVASASTPPGRLTVPALAQELRGQTGKLASRESAVRTYIAHLRRKLGDDPDRPTLLRHDSRGYWLVLGPPASP
jgi:DNA-binding response OmpR family regulator